ncbi:hypothetical protein BJ878DRAFT_55644 [Calycina marina]|uniref:DUF4048 domain-containing protein n=1 Tax=Calycina marina TaxID=1763456 RepID=A0A9P7Z3L6_9HELO|nr:hypothetical protein BJ878DRAFT_55644 [Calycina marina]
MASQNRRRSSIDPASVASILRTDTSLPPPVPSPYVGSSPNRENFPMAPPPLPSPRHTRSQSQASRPNRLSLSFPVTTRTGTGDSSRPTPPSSTVPSFPPTPIDIGHSPADPSGFLVAIAAQERKVFELKEELDKAEDRLRELKRQWSNQERTKKRAEIRQAEPLLSLQNSGTESRSSSEEARQNIELDRKRALLSISTPQYARRKILTGGHTRTLSLLSPERSNFTRPFPPVPESSEASLARSIKMPDKKQAASRASANRAARHSYQSGLTHNAKQVAEDLKLGMWTFLEDLRQATIGDEAVSGNASHQTIQVSHSALAKKVSKGNLNGRSSTTPKRAGSPRTWDSLTNPDLGLGLSDSPGPSWLPETSRRGVKMSGGTKPKTPRPLSFAPAVEDDDWSNWDSPTPKSPRWSGSTDASHPMTPANSNSHESAVKILDQLADGPFTPSKRAEEIQWPALDKLAPGNLRRTVSTLMQEWEKSLTPPPGNQSPEKTDQERSISQMPLL